MIDFMKQHEAYLQGMMAGKPSGETLRELCAFHDRRVGWMQHERLIHLLVTLFVCLFALLALGYSLARPSILCFLLSALLVLLAVAYLIYYYRIENRVQAWYRLAEKLRNPADQT